MNQSEKEQYWNFVEAFFHLVFWTLFISFVFDFGGLQNSFRHLFIRKDTNIVDDAFIFLPLAVGLFYGNYGYLTPTYLKRGRWVKYCAGLLLSFLLVYYLSDVVYHFLVQQGFDFRISNERFKDHGIQFYLETIIVSTSLGIAKTAMRNLAKKRAAEAKQKEAELKYLANQFNPHFLHNTLNGIYSKAIEENAPETTEAIVRLSEIMRYPINQGLKKHVPLAEEVKFIEDYIALQRLRLGEDYPIHFEKEEHLEGINILPLSLIVLVENSFKFGVSTKQKSPIVFRLKLVGDYLYFITENQIKINKHISSHNVGLENLQSRLDLLYKDNYNLLLEDKGDKYSVTLKLKRN